MTNLNQQIFESILIDYEDAVALHNSLYEDIEEEYTPEELQVYYVALRELSKAKMNVIFASFFVEYSDKVADLIGNSFILDKFISKMNTFILNFLESNQEVSEYRIYKSMIKYNSSSKDRSDKIIYLSALSFCANLFDGEYFSINNPTSVEIQFYPAFRKYFYNVLRNMVKI